MKLIDMHPQLVNWIDFSGRFTVHYYRWEHYPCLLWPQPDSGSGMKIAVYWN
jgi:hypothetical protein